MLEARAVQETLDENYSATGEPMTNNPELLDFCIDIGEAIVPPRLTQKKAPP